jgi:hypothetical protein
MTSTISITVESGTPIVIPFTAGMNAQDALETAYNQTQNAAVFSFALQFYGTYQGPPYGPLGYLVIGLNGVYDLPTQNTYWAFYVNGVMAAKGIDSTLLDPGDAIGFQNEEYSEAKHRGTHVEIKHHHHHHRHARQPAMQASPA